MKQFLVKTRRSTINGNKLISIDGKQEKIRYAPGESSIFVKDQSPNAKRKHIPVENQMVISNDELLTDYLTALSKSVGWIELYDENKYAEKANEVYENKAEAYALIQTSPAADVGVVAYMLGGRSLLYKSGSNEVNSIDVIKKSLYPMAETKATDIVKAFKQSDEKKMEFLVSKAFYDGILTYSPTLNKVMFTQSGQTVLNIKPNQGSDVEQVAAYFNTNEGKKDLGDVKNYFASKANKRKSFTEVDGIGDLTAKKMREAGFRTYEDVKKLTFEEFEAKLKKNEIKIVGVSVKDVYDELTK